MSIQPTAANERTVRALVDLLKSTSVGQRITYHQLKQAVGFDIRTNRFLLFRAMRIAADESGAIFSNVRQVGYERLPAKKAATLGQQRRRRVRRGLWCISSPQCVSGAELVLVETVGAFGVPRVVVRRPGRERREGLAVQTICRGRRWKIQAVDRAINRLERFRVSRQTRGLCLPRAVGLILENQCGQTITAPAATYTPINYTNS